jgi:hypothetical protein
MPYTFFFYLLFLFAVLFRTMSVGLKAMSAVAVEEVGADSSAVSHDAT